MQLSASHVGHNLSTLFPNGRWLATEGPRVQSCCIWAPKVRPGDLFVALDNTRWEAAESVRHAIARGAAAVLTERPYPYDIPQFLTEDTRIAFGRLCHALAGDPTSGLRSVAITGTYGKTLTQQLLVSIFNAADLACEGIAAATDAPTSGSETGFKCAAELASWLGRLRAYGGSHAVVEASSKCLAQHQLSGVQLDAAIITNVRREHVAWHGNLTNYRNAKSRLLRYLKPDGFALLNVDDPTSCQILADCNHPLLTVGMQRPADITANLIERLPSEQTFLLEAGDDCVAVRTQIVGDDHIYNCMAAAAVALAMGIDMQAVIRGIEAVQTVPGKLQRIECGQPFGVFIDASYSPDSLANVLAVLREVTGRRLHCVYGVDHPMTNSERARTGRMLERLADSNVLTSSAPSRKMSLKVAHEVLDGFDRPSQAQLMPDRTRAIGWTFSRAQQGDIVVLAGGLSGIGPDDQRLEDEDIGRYWLQHGQLDQARGWQAA